MTYDDLIKQQEQRKIIPEIIENRIATEVLLTYYETCPKHIYDEYMSEIQMLLNEYFYVNEKNQKNKKYFDQLLESYDFNFKGSIHNSLFYLLDKKKRKFRPELWPGIISIECDKNCYVLTTNVGTIRVYKASSLFTNVSSKYIFRKQLQGQCYARTYDFLEKNRDYKAVLSYIPNLFYGGFYHAYLEHDDHVLDIACNAFYDNKEDADKVLSGEIIKKLSYDEVEDECDKLSKEIGVIRKKDKLNVLSLYHDIVNHNI